MSRKNRGESQETLQVNPVERDNSSRTNAVRDSKQRVTKMPTLRNTTIPQIDDGLFEDLYTRCGERENVG